MFTRTNTNSRARRENEEPEEQLQSPVQVPQEEAGNTNQTVDASPEAPVSTTLKPEVDAPKSEAPSLPQEVPQEAPPKSQEQDEVVSTLKTAGAKEMPILDYNEWINDGGAGESSGEEEYDEEQAKKLAKMAQDYLDKSDKGQKMPSFAQLNLTEYVSNYSSVTQTIARSCAGAAVAAPYLGLNQAEMLTCIQLQSIAVSSVSIMAVMLGILSLLFFNRKIFGCMMACSKGFAACATAAHDYQNHPTGPSYSKASQVDREIDLGSNSSSCQTSSDGPITLCLLPKCVEAQKRVEAMEAELMKLAKQGCTAQFYRDLNLPLPPALEMKESSSEAEKSDKQKVEDAGKMPYAGNCSQDEARNITHAEVYIQESSQIGNLRATRDLPMVAQPTGARPRTTIHRRGTGRPAGDESTAQLEAQEADRWADYNRYQNAKRHYRPICTNFSSGFRYDPPRTHSNNSSGSSKRGKMRGRAKNAPLNAGPPENANGDNYKDWGDEI